MGFTHTHVAETVAEQPVVQNNLDAIQTVATATGANSLATKEQQIVAANSIAHTGEVATTVSNCCQPHVELGLAGVTSKEAYSYLMNLYEKNACDQSYLQQLYDKCSPAHTKAANEPSYLNELYVEDCHAQHIQENCTVQPTPIAEPIVGPIATPTVGPIGTPSYLQNLYIKGEDKMMVEPQQPVIVVQDSAAKCPAAVAVCTANPTGAPCQAAKEQCVAQLQGAAEVATTSDLCPAAQSVCTANPTGAPCIAAKAVCAETGEVVVGPTVGPIATPTIGAIRTPTIGAIETPSYLQNLYGDHVTDFCGSAKTVCTATGFEQAACKAAIADAQNAKCDLTWYTPTINGTAEVIVVQDSATKCPAAVSVCTANPTGAPCQAAKEQCVAQLQTGEVVVGPTVGPIATPTVGAIETPTVGAIETPSYLQNLYNKAGHVTDYCGSAKSVCTATGFEQAACKAAIADAQNAKCDLTWYTPTQTSEVLVTPTIVPQPIVEPQPVIVVQDSLTKCPSAYYVCTANPTGAPCQAAKEACVAQLQQPVVEQPLVTEPVSYM